LNIKNRYSPPYCLAICCPRCGGGEKNRVENSLIHITGSKPRISFSTSSFTFHLLCSHSTQIATECRDKLTIILHGEIYNAANGQAEFLLDHFAKNGINSSSCKDINGSFVIFFLDARNDVVGVITDRVNSRKVFCSNYKGKFYLSTSLYLQPIADTDIDPVGLACYLANGVVHNNRTVFDGVRVLERACVHKLAENGFDSTQYWSYSRFAKSHSGIDQKELQRELSELLIKSVRIRLNGNPKVFLSLSGGYDATAILGILGELKHPKVSAFSYALGEAEPNSDEYVSKKMASSMSIQHKIVQSYKGNLPDVINHNARMGQGLANFCDEIDAWMEMASGLDATSPSVLFVGDECFGWIDCKLNSNTEVLNSVAIYDFSGLFWLRPLLSQGIFNVLFDALKDELARIVRRCPPTQDYHDRKDFLYLDQRLGNVILPWREFVAGQFAVVRNPFLDNSILDFMLKVPSGLRRGKLLHKATVTDMFPELYRFPRGTTCSYIPNWRREFITQRPAVESLISSEDSKLDEMIPPDIIVKLLKENETRRRSAISSKRLSLKCARRLIGRSSLANKILARWTVSGETIHRVTLLKRLLVMRRFLADVTSHCISTHKMLSLTSKSCSHVPRDITLSDL